MNSEFTNLEFFYRLLALISLCLFGFSSPSWQDEPNPTLWLALRTDWDFFRYNVPLQFRISPSVTVTVKAKAKAHATVEIKIPGH